jgi:hypothetical protein
VRRVREAVSPSRKSRDRAKQGQITQRDDDGIHNEARLQNCENPAYDLKSYHADIGDDVPRYWKLECQSVL